MAIPAKIRVGLVGLNAPYSGTPTGINWAASAHLPYLLSSPKYELVALQNSSAERAALAIKPTALTQQRCEPTEHQKASSTLPPSHRLLNSK
jgi:predicted dehydrogenase